MFVTWLIKDTHKWLNEPIKEWLYEPAKPRYWWFLTETLGGFYLLIWTFPLWISFWILYQIGKVPVVGIVHLVKKHKQYKSLQGSKPTEF